MARKLIVIFVLIIIFIIAIGYIVYFGFNHFFNFKLLNPDMNTSATDNTDTPPAVSTNDAIIVDDRRLDLQAKIDNANNSAEIRKGFKDLINQIDGDNSYKPIPKWTIITDNNNHQVPIDNLTSAVGSSIPNNIFDLIDKNYYEFASCVGEKGEKSLGLILKGKVVEGYQPDLFQNMKEYEQDWELTLFHDTRAILFPNYDSIKLDELNSEVAFKDGKYRYADINLPDGKKGILSHAIVGGMFIISNSVDCMDKMSWAAEPSDGS